MISVSYLQLKRTISNSKNSKKRDLEKKDY